MDYDDGYPTCAETHVVLRIYPGDLDPTTVTERLGIEPSKVQRRGVVRPIMGVPKQAPLNGWFLDSEGHIESRDTRRHIDWLLDRVEGKAAALEALVESGARVDICCPWVSRSGHGGPCLSPAQLRRLADLGIEFWFDLYDHPVDTLSGNA